MLCAAGFCGSASAAGFESIARLAGFVYDPVQDIYYTRKDSLQRLLAVKLIRSIFIDNSL